MSVSQETKTQAAARSGWYGSHVSAVARELGVEPERGLSVEEARRRLQSQGPNRLTGAKKESGFQAFLRQYRDVMQLILLVAAVVNLLVTGDVGTSVVLMPSSFPRGSGHRAVFSAVSRPTRSANFT